jgi:hypothetical protein
LIAALEFFSAACAACTHAEALHSKKRSTAAFARVREFQLGSIRAADDFPAVVSVLEHVTLYTDPWKV